MEEESDLAFQYALYIIFVPVIVCILLGNSFVIWATASFKILRKNTANYFIASLAFIDIITGAIVIPLSFNFNGRDLEEGEDFLCDLFQCLHLFTTISSLLFIMAIAIDRYNRIKRPLRYKQFMRRGMALFCIALILLFSLACANGLIYLHHLLDDRLKRKCGYFSMTPLVSFFVLLIGAQPIIIILWIYRKLYVIAKHSKATHKLQNSLFHRNHIEMRRHSGGTFNGRPASREHPLQVENTAVLRNYDATKMIGVVVGVYYLFLIPSTTAFFLIELFPDWKNHLGWKYLFPWLYWFNSACNPVIYICFSSDFRYRFIGCFCHQPVAFRNPRNFDIT